MTNLKNIQTRILFPFWRCTVHNTLTPQTSLLFLVLFRANQSKWLSVCETISVCAPSKGELGELSWTPDRQRISYIGRQVLSAERVEARSTSYRSNYFLYNRRKIVCQLSTTMLQCCTYCLTITIIHYKQDDWRAVPSNCRKFSLCRHIQPASVAHKTSYSMSIVRRGVLSTGVKQSGHWNWPLTLHLVSILRMHMVVSPPPYIFMPWLFV